MPQVIPAASAIFYGRQQEMTHILSLLLRSEQAAIAVLGSGGIGKTSLALTLMHHEAVIQRFEGRRYFIACDAVCTAESLYDRFAGILGLNEIRPIASLKQRVAGSNLPLLITFDNFETPWEPAENREKVESFLSELLLIPQVSILVTLRGAERPSGVAWSKPSFLPFNPWTFNRQFKYLRQFLIL